MCLQGSLWMMMRMRSPARVLQRFIVQCFLETLAVRMPKMWKEELSW